MKRKDELYALVTHKVSEVMSGNLKACDKLQAICRLLKDNVPHYDWVGFYLVDKKRPTELVLGPFEGEQTEHIRIPFGRGICGQAASLKETFIVQDVSKQTNYLSCSPKVKSEIVIPILSSHRIVGELDIDSHVSSAFTLDDEVFLEKIAKMVSGLFSGSICA
jgi:GAF domain-containing protein